MTSQESRVPQTVQRGIQTAADATETSPVARVSTGGQKQRAPRPVSVQIGGQTLSIRTNHDTEFVEQLADHIDRKVAELQQAAPTAPISKLLMLASMTVAEELFRARQEIDRLRDEITQRTDAMLGLLDQAAGDPKCR